MKDQFRNPPRNIVLELKIENTEKKYFMNIDGPGVGGGAPGGPEGTPNFTIFGKMTPGSTNKITPWKKISTPPVSAPPKAAPKFFWHPPGVHTPPSPKPVPTYDQKMK